LNRNILSIILLTAIGLGNLAALSLEDAKKGAVGTDLALHVQQLKLEESQGNAQVNPLIPDIFLVGSATGTLVPLSDSGSVSGLSVAMGLEVSLSLDSTLGLQQDIKDLSVVSSALALESQRIDVETTLLQDYWTAAGYVFQAPILEQALENAKKQYTAAQERFTDGKITKLSMKQSQYSVQKAQKAVDDAEMGKQQAFEILSQVTGLDVDGSFDVMLEVRSLKSAEELLPYVMKTCGVRTAANAVETAALQEELTKASSMAPVVSFSFSSGNLGYDGSWSSTSGTSSTFFGDTASGTVAVSIPLGGHVAHSTAANSANKAVLDRQIAQTQLDAAKQSSLSSLRSTLYKIESYVRAYALEKDQLDFVTYQRDMVESQYRDGKSTYLDYEDAQMTFEKTQLAILQDQLNYTLSVYSLSALLEVTPEKLYMEIN
jgi:outer membrane protein TolC